MTKKKTIVKILLSDALKKSEMSISELSRKTGMERKSIYNILNHESDPQLCSLVKIAKALNIKVESLIEY